MKNVVNFNPNVKVVEVTQIPKGSDIILLGSVENGKLSNTKILPPYEEMNIDNIEERIDYEKRYVICQGIDMVLKRIQEDEHLKGHPVSITIFPQEIQEIKSPTGTQKQLKIVMSLGTPIKAKVLDDTTIEFM